MLSNAEYRQEFRSLTSVRTIPVTVIGERLLIGWDRAEYTAAIDALADTARPSV